MHFLAHGFNLGAFSLLSDDDDCLRAIKALSMVATLGSYCHHIHVSINSINLIMFLILITIGFPHMVHELSVFNHL